MTWRKVKTSVARAGSSVRGEGCNRREILEDDSDSGVRVVRQCGGIASEMEADDGIPFGDGWRRIHREQLRQTHAP